MYVVHGFRLLDAPILRATRLTFLVRQALPLYYALIEWSAVEVLSR